MSINICRAPVGQAVCQAPEITAKTSEFKIYSGRHVHQEITTSREALVQSAMKKRDLVGEYVIKAVWEDGNGDKLRTSRR